MYKKIALIYLLVIPFALMADQYVEEVKLLKSWGFEFNEKGKLIFNIDDKDFGNYKPWSQQANKVELGVLPKNPSKKLSPLVISSKSKSTH